MAKKQKEESNTRYYKPFSKELKLYAQFLFLEFVRELEPRVIEELKTIFENWRDLVKLPEYKEFEDDIKELWETRYGTGAQNIGSINLRDICIDFNEAVRDSLQMTNTQRGEYLDQKDKAMEIVMQNPDLDAFDLDQMTPYSELRISDYKQILKDNKLLDAVNCWIEKWNLEKKNWLYRWIVINFRLWAGGYEFEAQSIKSLEPEREHLTDSQLYNLILYREYCFNPKERFEILKEFPPPEFKFGMWRVNWYSIQEYEKQLRSSFESQLQEFLKNLHKKLNKKGYRKLRRNIDWTRLKWLVRRRVQRWSKEDILQEICDQDPETEGISDRTLNDAFQTFREKYDLPDGNYLPPENGDK